MSNVIFFFCGMLVIYSEIFLWSYFYNEKLNYKSFAFYVSLFSLTFLGSLNYFYVNTFIRISLISIFLCLFNWLIFHKKLNETVISVLLVQFLLAIAEVIYFIVLVFILRMNMETIQGSIIGTFFGNFSTSLLLFVLGRFYFVQKIYLKMVSLTNFLGRKRLLIICLFFALSINILMATIYYKLNFSFIIVINFLLLLIYFYIIYRIINERSINSVIKSENDSLMNSLHQYEEMVDRQRVDNHENKNQLLIIRNMISKKDKDVLNYIDTVVKNQMEDDEILYTRVMTIPSGGLQGIIYQKMLVMKDENILFSLDVSRDVRKIDLDNFSMEDNYKLCKIVGVFLDNAIEESKIIEDKRIMISLYVDDDNLVIDISNKFEGEIDLERLDEEGYTTKDEGHGYGLSLVKKILSESDVFVNERSIKKNVFKQVVKVKIKNT